MPPLAALTASRLAPMPADSARAETPQLKSKRGAGTALGGRKLEVAVDGGATGAAGRGGNTGGGAVVGLGGSVEIDGGGAGFGHAIGGRPEPTGSTAGSAERALDPAGGRGAGRGTGTRTEATDGTGGRRPIRQTGTPTPRNPSATAAVP